MNEGPRFCTNVDQRTGDKLYCHIFQVVVCTDEKIVSNNIADLLSKIYIFRGTNKVNTLSCHSTSQKVLEFAHIMQLSKSSIYCICYIALFDYFDVVLATAEGGK